MSKNSKGLLGKTLILGTAGALGLALLLPLGASASLDGGSMAVKATDGGTGYAKVYGPAALTSAGSGSTPVETAPPERHWGDFYSVSIGGLPASSYGKLATVETSDADGNTVNLESNVRISPTGVVTVSHSAYLSVHPDQLPLGVEISVNGTSQSYSYQFHYGQENFIASTKTLELKGSIVNGAIVPEKPRR